MPISKKSFAATACGLFVLIAANGALAQEKDWSITLGLKAWLNQWESWISPSNLGGNVISETSNLKLAPIPSVSFKYRDFFVSSSYFAKTSYKFPTYDELNPTTGLTTTTFKADRKEFDLNFGWYFVPRLAVTLGLKQVDQDFTITRTGSGFSGAPGVAKYKYAMPTVGITGSAPISDRFAMYGTGAWGPAVATTINGTKNSNYSGFYNASEFGLAWLAAQNFTMTLGYKYQIIQNKIKSSDPILDGLVYRDVTDGWAIGGLLSF